MIRRFFHADDETLKLLNRILIGLVTVAAILAIVCGVRTVMLRSAEDTLRASITAQRDTLAQVTSSIRETKVSTPVRPKADGNLLAKFQSFVESSANENGCQVQEFASTSEPVPYASRFDTSTMPAGWTQVEVKIGLTGTAAAVVNTLKSLSRSDLLYEFNSLEMQRGSVDAAGTAAVNAQIAVRVLQRQESA